MDIDETTRPLLDREKDADTDFEVARRRPRQVSGYIGIVGAFVCGVLASCLFMLLCAPVSSPSSPLASSELDSAKLPACRPTDAGKIVAPKQSMFLNCYCDLRQTCGRTSIWRRQWRCGRGSRIPTAG